MMESTKSFKIRRTGGKIKTAQELQEQEEVANLQDLRIDENNQLQKQMHGQQQPKAISPAQYENDEEQVNCYRFPHSNFCGCNPNCLLQSFDPIEVVPNLFFGNFVSGLKAKHMLDIGITHVLNVTCKQYTKRNKYFKYSNIDLQNTTEEDAKKFYRLSNRFIEEALEQGGKVFIHCSVMQIGAMMACAYLIGVRKISLKHCLNQIIHTNIEISPHFLKQLEAYDLQKMAFVSIQRE